MLSLFFNWWLCRNEPKGLHETKIKFFKKAKEAGVKECVALWEIAKAFYPNSLATEDLDRIIAGAKGETA